jgi:carboxylesterase type B
MSLVLKHHKAAIWQAGVWETDPSNLVDAFNAAEKYSEALKTLYHIYPDRPSSCKTGSLDFINDYRFLLPIHHLEKTWKAVQKPVYRYLVDESNPWQPSSGAHHAVDLPLLFGGFDMSFSPSAGHVGKAMREAWIKFVNLEEPWTDVSGTCYGFGPHGMTKTLEDWEVQSRRRVTETDILGTMDSVLLDKTLAGLAAGKVSLLN